MKNLRIAIQKNGRLFDGSIEYLRSCGLEFDLEGADMLVTCSNFPVEIMFVRDDDIPAYIDGEVADFGIVGQNVLFEKNVSLKQLLLLGFAQCKLVLALPNGSVVKNLRDFEGMRIATSYPRILRQFLDENSIKAAIIELAGSVELATGLNLADAVCDLVQSGRTLEENGLNVFLELMKSQAVLISKQDILLEDLSNCLTKEICKL